MSSSSEPRILEPERVAPWCATVQLTFFAADSLEAVPRDQISCAFVLPTSASGAIELGLHKKRGWDLLGGHVEEGETAAAAALRELKEESGRVLLESDLTLLGYERLVETGPRYSLKHPYPVSYFVYYTARNVDTTLYAPRTTNEADDDEEEEEMTQTRFFTPAELSANAWFAARPSVLRAVTCL